MALKSYICVVLGIVFAKAAGFIRDIFFASKFGTSTEADIYFTVFSMVTLIFTGIGVALSTLIIKNLNKQNINSEKAQKEYVSYFINRTLIILAFLTVFLYIFASPLTRLILPGISDEAFPLALKITYIMIPSLSFVIIAYIIYGVLQNKRVFFITSVMSVPYNLIVIASLFIPNVNILFISFVTTVGWFLHIIILLPDFYRQGYRLFLPARNKNYSMQSKEILWIFISNMMFQLCRMMDKSMVSADAGMASCVNYASNLFVTIASVFIVAMSSVTFPSIMKNYEEQNIKFVNATVQNIISVMLAIFLPIVLVFILFKDNIISLVFERGEFSSSSTSSTAQIFMLYSLCTAGYIAEQLFNKILFLKNMYKYTVWGTVGVVVLKFILNLVLIPKFGASGAAASTALLLSAYAVLILIKMKDVIGNYISAPLIISTSKIIVSAMTSFLIWALMYFAFPSLTFGRYSFIAAILICGFIYIFMLFATGELRAILKRLKIEKID